MNRSAVRLIRHLALAALLMLALPAAASPLISSVHTAGQSLGAHSKLSTSSLPAIEFVDSFGGTIQTLAISGTNAFLIQGNTLTVLDVSAPAAPARIGRMPLAEAATNLTAVNGIVYVAEQTIIQIIDVHNPALPVEISRFRAKGYVDHIQVAGSFAYLSEFADGVELIDISDPSRPIWRAQYALSVCGTCFLVVGNLAYVVTFSNVLTILDISNPIVPISRGTYTLSVPAETSFWHVIVEGARAYIGAFTSIPSGTQPRLITFDIAHPESPLLLGNIEFAPSLVAVVGNIAYAASNTQIQLFDVGDPTQPIARGTYTGTLTQATGDIVQVAGNRVYLVEDQAAFKVLDVSNPDNLAVLGSYTTLPGLKSPTIIQVAGSTGYALSRGLQILDLTTPISPTLRGFYPSEYANYAHAHGSHVYLDNSGSALDLLDVSNPDLITRIATINISSVQAVEEANNRAYILTSEREGCGRFCIIIHNMLTIFDISNPSAPVFEGRTLLFDSSSPEPSSVVVKGSFAYVAWDSALRIVDLSTPATPVVRLNYPLAGIGNLMQMVGNLAYVTTTAGLTILDITDPLKPNLLGQTGSLGYAYSIQVQGSTAFVGGTSGVRVIDISDPTQPISRAAYADQTGRVGALGDTIYIAGGTAGLNVLRLHPDRFPPPMFVPLTRH